MWGCKASFYRKTTWQAFIFHQKKSLRQHVSEIGGGRCNCLLGWHGMTVLLFLARRAINNMVYELLKPT